VSGGILRFIGRDVVLPGWLSLACSERFHTSFATTGLSELLVRCWKSHVYQSLESRLCGGHGRCNPPPIYKCVATQDQQP
jgi:hypothetical protein